MVAGVVGAFLGSLLGVVCIVVLGQLGYVASLSGLVMAVCALKGYELLGGRLSKKGAVLSSVLILVMTFAAYRLDWAISVAQALEVGVFDAFRSIGYLLEAEAIESAPYWGGLVMLYLFTLLGAVPTIVGGLRTGRRTAAPLGTAVPPQPELDPTRQMKFYPPAKGWTGRLRASVFLSVILPMLIVVVLFAMGGGESGEAGFFAGMGAILSVFWGVVLMLPVTAALRAENILMVRGPDGTFWRIRLDELNTQPGYRFTKNSGLWQALTWNTLTPDEQRLARDAAARGILDRRGVESGGPPTRAVLPLAELTVVKEDRWRWKLSCQGRDGVKKMSLAKIFPELSFHAEGEPPQGPLPFAWGWLAIVLACTLALSAVGWVCGSVLEGGGPSARRDRDYTTASVPERAVDHTQRGVVYQVDGAFEQPDPQMETYLDEATGAYYTVTVSRDATEESATEQLTRPLSDFRMDDTFDRFQFDRVDTASETSLASLTAQNGETYRYNILSVYFTDGYTYHLGVALSDTGGLLEVEAAHGDREDESAVKSALLYMLQSAAFPASGGEGEVTAENYQSLFQLAADQGYESIGVAYIRAPADMFGKEAFVDAYIPYGERAYLNDGYAVESTAHGMRVGVTLAYSEVGAKDVVDRAYQSLVDGGMDLYDEGVYDTEYFPDEDIAYKQITYFEGGGAKPRVALLYADTRREGYYLAAQITYLLDETDDGYSTQVEELGDVYALELPEIEPMN